MSVPSSNYSEGGQTPAAGADERLPDDQRIEEVFLRHPQVDGEIIAERRFRAKAFSLFLKCWTLMLGLATPVLCVLDSAVAVRAYSRFWARGVSWGIRKIFRLRHRYVGDKTLFAPPKLIISNRQSMWEAIIFAAEIPDVTFVARRNLAKIPIVGWYIKHYPMVLIDRNSGTPASPEMIERARTAVEQGRSIMIFLEDIQTTMGEVPKSCSAIAALYHSLSVPTVLIAHDSGTFWNVDIPVVRGEITVKIMGQVEAGLTKEAFCQRIENLIKSDKTVVAVH